MSKQEALSIVSHKLPITMAMTAPAVRTVVVEVIVERKSDGTWEPPAHDIYPVLAILARERHVYNGRVHEGRRFDIHPEHGGMTANGWRYDQSGPLLEFDAVIHTSEYGICEASFALGDTENTAHRIVVAPWLPEDDATKLASVVDELVAEAQEKVERSLARQSQPKQ